MGYGVKFLGFGISGSCVEGERWLLEISAIGGRLKGFSEGERV